MLRTCVKARRIDAPFLFSASESVFVGSIRYSDASNLRSDGLLRFLLDMLKVLYAELLQPSWALTNLSLFSGSHVLLVQRDQVRVWENMGERPGEWEHRVPLNEGIFRRGAVVLNA